VRAQKPTRQQPGALAAATVTRIPTAATAAAGTSAAGAEALGGTTAAEAAAVAAALLSNGAAAVVAGAPQGTAAVTCAHTGRAAAATAGVQPATTHPLMLPLTQSLLPQQLYIPVETGREAMELLMSSCCSGWATASWSGAEAASAQGLMCQGPTYQRQAFRSS
jgi:hypothetical protein